MHGRSRRPRVRPRRLPIRMTKAAFPGARRSDAAPMACVVSPHLLAMTDKAIPPTFQANALPRRAARVLHRRAQRFPAERPVRGFSGKRCAVDDAPEGTGPALLPREQTDSSCVVARAADPAGEIGRTSGTRSSGKARDVLLGCDGTGTRRRVSKGKLHGQARLRESANRRVRAICRCRHPPQRRNSGP